MEMMENLLRSGKPVLEIVFLKKLAQNINGSSKRAGKTAINWMQIQNWYKDRLQWVWPSKFTSPFDAYKLLSLYPGVCPPMDENDEENCTEENCSKVEFEARSSKEGAWYDVDTFMAYRTLSSGEAEVHVRFSGFGPEEDEWVNVRTDVRVRSLAVESSDCDKIKVGDLVLCYQVRKNRAIYYDAHVVEIKRRKHSKNGCKCLFIVRYIHDNTMEKARLGRLYGRPI